MIDYTEGAGCQYHTALPPEQTGRYVLLTGDPGRVEQIARQLQNPEFVASNREYVTWNGQLEGETVTVISHGIGAPSTAIAMEELIKNGAHTFIRLGTCGGIDLDVLGGDLVIASAAIRQEGTTREYAPIEFPAVADFEVISALNEAANEKGFRHHIGVVQSKDSFFGQHEPQTSAVSDQLEKQWKAWKMLHTKASEMEGSTLFILGSLRNVRTGAIFTAFANQERELAHLSNEQNHDLRPMMETGIEAMRKLILADRAKEKTA